MTTTPTLWNDLTQANTTDGGFIQTAATVTALADGGYFVAWTDQSNPMADNVFAQRYDIFGHKVGMQIDIDKLSTRAAQPSSALLSDGSLAVAFTSDDGAKEILVHRYSASLGSFVTDTIGAGSFASIAGFADGGYVVAEKVDDGGTQITAHIVSAAGVVGPSLAINTDSNNDRSRLAVLSNGNFVVSYDHNGDVHMQIRSKAGAVVLADAGVSGANDGVADESFNDVAALKNGGFVVAWEDSSGDSDQDGVHATIYTNAGAVVADNFQVNTTEAGDQYSPFITSLSDGGFIVSWQDDMTLLTQGQRFDATGHRIGVEYTLQDGADVENPSRAVELKDGRVAYGLGHIDGMEEDINTVIVDPRTSPINGTAGVDALTSRIDGATVNGLDGNDTLYGFAGIDRLNGGKGDDVLSGGDNSDLLAGGKGDDKLAGDAGADGLFGNKGDDRLDGAAGADVIEGGRGADRMHAGSDDDKDVFVFTSKHDSGHDDKSGWDRLYDFDTHGKHEAVSDRIDLSAIDADKGQKHDQEFRFVHHFKDAPGDQPAGEVTVVDAGKNVKVLVDVNGDKDADMIFLVMHVDHLHKADFLL